MAPKKTLFSPKKKTKSQAASASMPRVSSLMPKAAPAAGTSSKLLANNSIELSIMPYTRRASDIMQSLPDEPLFQVQIKHDAKPSVTNRILASMNNFRSCTQKMPSTLAALRTEAGILLQITGHDDPHGAGFIPWRIAFYVVGATCKTHSTCWIPSLLTARPIWLTMRSLSQMPSKSICLLPSPLAMRSTLRILPMPLQWLRQLHWTPLRLHRRLGTRFWSSEHVSKDLMSTAAFCHRRILELKKEGSGFWTTFWMMFLQVWSCKFVWQRLRQTRLRRLTSSAYFWTSLRFLWSKRRQWDEALIEALSSVKVK